MLIWLTRLLSLAHIVITLCLCASAPELMTALGGGDIGAAVVLLAGSAAVVAGARLTCATLLSGLAYAAGLFGRTAAQRCAQAAIAMSPVRFRRVFAASCAGLILTGTGFATAAAAAPDAPSPGWPTRPAESSTTAPSSPGWPTRSPDAPAASPTPAPEGSTSAPADGRDPTTPYPDDSTAQSDASGTDSGPDADDRTTESSGPETATVSAGDSLWTIAAEHYTGAASAELSDRVESIHSANRHIIGADPNLIMPGQRLEMP
ncbi:LysM peptidoglycan-binding domain-containing protein [Brevibacterium luteolum]|uniref:LysM peptidoglycan-binding domain-containing protein n=1 Tax=Brevibacterium luteolum TaxID=199591 RepID=UPI00223C3223|nr:LysM domain-containing protein [Brevibacterium luteolum]MCT1658028.1 LysM peptidoglycan-binding domain-containing protein [Brevibacterium luteolum]